MTRTTPVDPLSHSVSSRVKPLFLAWTISMDSIVPAIFATGAECVKWSADLGLSVTSRLLDSLMKFLRAGRSVSGCGSIWMRTLQITGGPFPRPLPVFCEKTITSTLVSTPTFPEIPWILRGVDG